MLNGFTFGGIHSSSLGVYLRSIDRALLPEMVRRERGMSRKNGTYDFGDNVYRNRRISAEITFFSDSMIANKLQARDVASWLNSQGEAQQLIFDDEPDKYYMARIYTGVNFTTKLGIGDASIAFECQPFAYSIYDTGVDDAWEDADYPWITNGLRWGGSDNYTFTATGLTSFVFDNPATQETGVKSPQTSKFDIIINGSWTDIEITLNGKTLEYTAVGVGELVIDNVNMEVTLNAANTLSNLDGDLETFLEAEPGSNEITIDGTNVDVTVLIDFRPEWR